MILIIKIIRGASRSVKSHLATACFKASQSSESERSERQSIDVGSENGYNGDTARACHDPACLPHYYSGLTGCQASPVSDRARCDIIRVAIALLSCYLQNAAPGAAAEG